MFVTKPKTQRNSTKKGVTSLKLDMKVPFMFENVYSQNLKKMAKHSSTDFSLCFIFCYKSVISGCPLYKVVAFK